MEKEFTLIPDGKYKVEMDYVSIGKRSANLRFQITEGERKGEYLFITIHATNYMDIMRNICYATRSNPRNIPEDEINASYLLTFYNIPLVVESVIRDIPMSRQFNAIIGFHKIINEMDSDSVLFYSDACMCSSL
jgi:hypothetical protein